MGKEEDFIIIKEIATELEYGYALHNSLLKDYTDFPGEYERICRIRIKSLFEKRYQFQEALENHIRENLSNDVHIVEMHPLLLPTFQKQFTLFKIFEPQAIPVNKEDPSETRSKEKYTGGKSIEEIVEERQLANFKVYAYFLITAIEKDGNIDLAAYLDNVEKILGVEGIENVDLIPFLIDLNSGSEIRLHTNASGDTEIAAPFETHFNLAHLRESKGNSEPIEVALRAACETANLPFQSLRVIADPRERVSIGGKKNIYISNMEFIGE
ncbi:hypothetical protein [Methanocalculus sp.]|uniref:hypothetical protein n=1 Tax=Methanocalculus sp. TaxID=2004547 RepID=UPI002616E415|nr:hypothetical protein [Methanocalculus sp.]MDG6250296.1 hypothetical protein [Methanocalculus sp.]